MRRLLVFAALAALLAGCDRLIERQLERNLTRVDQSVLTSPDLQVVICGSGSPLADPTRAAACTAVIAGGELVMVDAGPGSWEVLDQANVPVAELSAVLLTHFHSDHIGGLGEAITQSWIAGRDKPLAVYGPEGVERVVSGFAEAYAADVDYRVAHHDDAFMPRAAAVAEAHTVALAEAPDASAVVFERNGLKVTMFRVDHDPVRPAVGYRFDFAGRSVVVSGDCAKSASMVVHAKGADVLIHEALERTLIARAVAASKRLGLERQAKLAGDIQDYHASPVEAAEIARDAGVAELVFTHLVPSPNNFLTRRIFLAGVADVFKGKVVIAEDGMRISLPPR
jgi:ribonuclease Z